MKEQQLADTTQAAEILGGIKPNTLEGWRVRGTGPRFIKCGHLVRYRIKDLNDWLEAQTRKSTSQVKAQGGDHA
jgi:hypothetical protein